MLLSVYIPPRDYLPGNAGVGLDFFTYVLLAQLPLVGASIRDIWGGVLSGITNGPVVRYGEILLVDRRRASSHVSKDHRLV